MKSHRMKSIGLALLLAVVTSLGAPFAGASDAPSPAKVNVNAATTQQLEALPGIGPKLAARIVEYRQKAGSFKTVQELLNVQGIGEKNLAKLQAFLTVGEAPAQPKAAAR